MDKDNEFSWPEINEYKSNGYCYALKTQIAILSDGTVVPCCLDSNGEATLGNIFETKFEEILNNNQSLLNDFQNHKMTLELCKKCSYRLRFDSK